MGSRRDGGGTAQSLQDAGDTIPLFRVSLRPFFFMLWEQKTKMNKKAGRPEWHLIKEF
jgi:hypothetical protein